MQLRCGPVTHICSILLAARSPYIGPFLSSFSNVEVTIHDTQTAIKRQLQFLKNQSCLSTCDKLMCIHFVK